MNLDLRPMSNSQLLDRTFQLYLRHFPLFVGIAIPSAIVSLLPVLFAHFFGSGPFTKNSFTGAASGFLGFCVSMAGDALILGATISTVSAVHLNRTTTIGAVYRELAATFSQVFKVVVLVNFKALWLIAASVLVMVAGAALGIFGGVLIFAGGLAMLVGVVAAIWAYFHYAVAVPVCVVEHLAPRQSLRRSSFLADGDLGRILLIEVLGVVVAALAGGVLNSPLWLNDNVHHFMSLGPQTQVVWKQLAEFGSNVLAGPVRTIALSLFYYDMRVRKEAFDLQLMMSEIDSPQASVSMA